MALTPQLRYSGRIRLAVLSQSRFAHMKSTTSGHTKILCRLTACFLAAGCGVLAAAQPEPTVQASVSARNQAALPPLPRGICLERDLAYLEPNREEKLDLYYPADRGKDVRSPGIVIIHGGGWTGGDKGARREYNIGTTLAAAGYVCVSVEYYKGKDRWPTNLFDCKNGVRFLRANRSKYQIDPDRIGVIGGSAGGHLALMVAYTSGLPELSPKAPYPEESDAVQACVDLYGPSNLETRQATDPDGTPNGKLREAGLFPGSRSESGGKWAFASPVYHVTSQCPPTLILHGDADTTVDRDQSRELAKTLAQHGVEHRLVMLPGVGHTFDLQTWKQQPLPFDLRPLVTEFLDKHLKAHRGVALPEN